MTSHRAFPTFLWMRKWQNKKGRYAMINQGNWLAEDMRAHGAVVPFDAPDALSFQIKNVMPAESLFRTFDFKTWTHLKECLAEINVQMDADLAHPVSDVRNALGVVMEEAGGKAELDVSKLDVDFVSENDTGLQFTYDGKEIGFTFADFCVNKKYTDNRFGDAVLPDGQFASFITDGYADWKYLEDLGTTVTQMRQEQMENADDFAKAVDGIQSEGIEMDH